MAWRHAKLWRILAYISGAALLAFAVLALSAGSLWSSEEFPVAPPPLTPGIFPCSSCHAAMKPNTTKRELMMHSEIKLRHAPGVITWCFVCHDAANRDKFHLVNGDLIDFTESYRLCGECHGTNYRDWKAGIHGKRTGYFSGGSRMYFLCVSCHNPHDPKFKPLKPEPPPFRPLDKENGP
jgi:hypothetical protein